MRCCRTVFVLITVLSCGAFSTAQSVSATSAKTPSILPGLGTLHHPTSTKSPEAQQFFDQGLRLIYAFNHEEAARSFQRAAEIDPQLAMAWWGAALRSEER